MTKYDLADLIRAKNILESNGFDKNAAMLQSLIDKYARGELKLEHNYFNDDMAKAVAEEEFEKGITYSYSINREQHGDYTLTMYEEAEWHSEYQNYETDEDAKADIYLLEELGYTINH